MNVKKVMSLFALFGALSVSVLYGSANAKPAGQDETRIQRLAGLGRLWGLVKYFHPSTASAAIDWDRALVETIPLVDAVKTADEYRKAVDHLLSFLKDPMTKTLGGSETAAGESPQAAAAPSTGVLSLSRPREGIAVIKVDDYSLFTIPEKTQELGRYMAEAAGADTVILDIRRKPVAASRDNGISLYYFNQVFMQNIPLLFEGECPLPSSRHRVHTGYPPQVGESSGGYSTGFQYEQASSIVGRNPKSPELVFLIDGIANGVEAALSGLQSSGRGVIIQEGGSEAQELGAETYAMTLPDGIAVQIRMTETINPDGSIGFRPAVVVGTKTAVSDPAMESAMEIASGKIPLPSAGSSFLPPNPVRVREKSYPEMAYPNREYRLLSLFRFWNVIHYFYPYKSLMDIPWGRALEDFIPRFEEAGDAADYILCVEELVARLNDSHGMIYSPDTMNHIYTPPIVVKEIEGHTVVTNVMSAQDGSLPEIGVGDVILAVDGEDIAARRERLGRMKAASTPQSLSVRVHQNLFHGTKDSETKIKFRDAKGNVNEISVRRTARFLQSERTTPVFGVLPEGFGYMDLARLQPGDVEKALEAVRKTPALIMDMRGYPQGTIWSIAPRLAKEKTVVARFQGEEIHAGSALDIPFRLVVEATTEPGGSWRYEGKVVVLINEDAISQAEHTCLFLEAAAHALFVGSPTMGANGDVTRTVLPGRIVVNFTGIDVRHGDGRQLQRVGIQPDIPVRPTIKGIREGRDEVLERAIKELKKGKTK